jgi:hypothetical protein
MSRLKTLLWAGAATAVLAFSLTSPSKAAIIDIGNNPTSATGDFSTSPAPGAFTDFVTFTLSGGPQHIVIANATNVFAGPGDQIAQWTAAIFQQVGVPGGGDDVLLFGPQAASPCAVVNCQQVGGSGIFDPGAYYVQFAGIAGANSGYGGNVSSFAVPGPIAGAGIPGLVAAIGGFLGWRRLRRVA